MQLKIYAVLNVETNIVENIILWDGETNWTPPINTYILPLEGTEAGIGWKFEGGVFVDIRPLVTQEIAINPEIIITEEPI